MGIRWTEPAAHALETIQDYIAKENRKAAFEVAQRIQAAVSQLDEFPKMGRVGRLRSTYELVIPGLPYIVPYRIDGKDIHILSVYHTSRKWPDTFE